MRADMAKVYAERPSGGSRFCLSPKLRLNRGPDLPRSIGLKRHVQEWTRHTGQNLKWDKGGGSTVPLARFLQRRVGRRWDRVYHEICAQLDVRDPRQRSVRRCLCDLVVFVSRGRWGELMGEGQSLSPRRFNTFWRQRCFYVDPDDGLLKDHARFWRDHREGDDAC